MTCVPAFRPSAARPPGTALPGRWPASLLILFVLGGSRVHATPAPPDAAQDAVVAATASPDSAEPQPVCQVPKPSEVQCYVWNKRGFALDIQPTRPGVSFQLQVYEASIPFPVRRVWIREESSRQVTYRFNDPVAWLGRPWPIKFEAWIVKCQDHNGWQAPCRELLKITPVQIP